MQTIRTEVVVVGAGQAGIATSEHLKSKNIDHVILERDQIASRWRSERWDSLVANGPAWHDRFPGLEFDGNPERFAPKDEVADYMVKYTEKFSLPVHEGVEVTKVFRQSGHQGFHVETTNGVYDCDFVVAATGAFQVPVIPSVVPADENIFQIHSSEYRNPTEIPAGAVLVVGSGSSGVQIAQELRNAGREVYLSVGAHDRPPRRYRNRDFVYWLGVLGKWDMTVPDAGAEHVTIAVTGSNGGFTIDFRELAANGVNLVGRSASYENGVMHFQNDLPNNIHAGDLNYLALLKEADEFIASNGLDLPEEPEAHQLKPDPECVRVPILSLNLKEKGISNIIWATGFKRDYSWLDVEGAIDKNGDPKHSRGKANAHGVYFVGLPWQSRRGSSFIWGAWHDAKFVADQIEIQASYRDYSNNNVK